MNFRQNFSQKKHTSFAISEKKLSPRLFITDPKAYAKETPFIDLLLNSHMYIYVYIDIPAPSKGCQINPKGWWIDTL